MTNSVEKKRSIPNTICTEGLHKYFKPLREISNHQIASSVTESENSNNITPVANVFVQNVCSVFSHLKVT
jgi:hypothetical protein